MKKVFVLFLFGFLLSFPGMSLAQSQETAVIQTLVVDLWPDFDQPSVLVLYTGTVSADTPLPATISLPMPANATLNAVARITSDDVMVDDIEYTNDLSTTGNGLITFTTPDSRFRMEYYMPYEADGNQRTFSYHWEAPVDVAQLEVVVQQPLGASSLNVVPTASNIDNGEPANTTYYTLPLKSVLAGETYDVQVEYELDTPALTIALDQPAPAAETAVIPPSVDETSSNETNWPLILSIVGGVFIVGALVIYLISSRSQQPQKRKPAPRKPPAKRPTKGGKATFCHKCGTQHQRGDKFCRECGTAVKK